jgi:hypothetical protein
LLRADPNVTLSRRRDGAPVMLSTFCRPAVNAALSAARRFGRNRWLAIAVEKPWAESDALRDLHQCDNQSDRVVVALRNLLFGSAALTSASALRFTTSQRSV